MSDSITRYEKLMNEFLQTGTMEQWVGHLATASNFAASHRDPISEADLRSLLDKDELAFLIYGATKLDASKERSAGSNS